MRELSEILHTGAWAGKRAFVVGSGPSLARFDFELLRDELTIRANEEYCWGPTISICQDVRFFFGDGTPGRLPAYLNPAWYLNPKGSIPVFFRGHPDRPDPPVFNDKIFTIGAAAAPGPPGEGLSFYWGRTLEEGLCYGANVGLAALNLADVLGAETVYLLGFDCCAHEMRTHHHDLYPAEWRARDVATQNETYQIWLKDFRRWAPFVRAKVVNLNPDSALDCFPREPWGVPFTEKYGIRLNPKRRAFDKWFICILCQSLIEFKELSSGLAICSKCVVEFFPERMTEVK